MTTNFCGLLYLTDGGGRHSNLRHGRDANTTYILCAAFCAKTLQAVGGSFALITNRKEWVASALEKHGIDWVTVLECAFSLDVPQGIPFYQAHFKLDIFSAFAQGMFGDRVGLIDIDALFLRALRQTPGASLEVYDISEQVFPAYGKNRVVDDLQHVAGRPLADARCMAENISAEAKNSSPRSPNTLRNAGLVTSAAPAICIISEMRW